MAAGGKRSGCRARIASGSRVVLSGSPERRAALVGLPNSSSSCHLWSAVLKHRLVAVFVLAFLVSGCAASRAYRRGNDAARAGNWDAAVAHYTAAVQENPGKAEYKIELERAMQTASRE